VGETCQRPKDLAESEGIKDVEVEELMSDVRRQMSNVKSRESRQTAVYEIAKLLNCLIK